MHEARASPCREGFAFLRAGCASCGARWPSCATPVASGRSRPRPRRREIRYAHGPRSGSRVGLCRSDGGRVARVVRQAAERPGHPVGAVHASVRTRSRMRRHRGRGRLRDEVRAPPVAAERLLAPGLGRHGPGVRAAADLREGHGPGDPALHPRRAATVPALARGSALLPDDGVAGERLQRERAPGATTSTTACWGTISTAMSAPRKLTDCAEQPCRVMPRATRPSSARTPRTKTRTSSGSAPRVESPLR